MSITPDGKTIYLPSLEGPHWTVVNASNGDVIAAIVVNSGSHNTIAGLDGKEAYLAGLKSPILNVADTRTQQVVKKIGPFSNVVRPFTVNGAQTLCFVNVNDLLGFEVGDLKTGKMLYRVEVPGAIVGPTKRHGCPSHGIALTPDEKELWLTDAANERLHIFDASLNGICVSSSCTIQDVFNLLSLRVCPFLVQRSTICKDSVEHAEQAEHHNRLLIEYIELVADGVN